ncbi:unnamed protein product, partial [Brachionus calyciflorus]
MLEAKIIRPSKSPWSSPIIVVPKKNGQKRICIDYRKLNSITETEKWPLPNINDLLDRLRDSVWFSVIDLKSGYWQILMDDESITLTAFTTPDGHYEFVRLPFGFKNAPTDFSRIMKMIFGDLTFVEVYIDDIIVHSIDFTSHLEHIREVFRKLRNANLRLNPDKCAWFSKEVKVLGHIVSHNLIKMDPQKIEAISKRKAPPNLKQLQSFIGMCNQYRRFIKDFSCIAKPLFHLFSKNVKFEWHDDCQTAFQTLKKKLCSYPILRIYDPKKPCTLYVDASGFALGAILTQKDENGNEYTIAFASILLNKSEISLTITEKECLSIVFGIKEFRIYLHGIKFSLVVDHWAVVNLGTFFQHLLLA